MEIEYQEKRSDLEELIIENMKTPKNLRNARKGGIILVIVMLFVGFLAYRTFTNGEVLWKDPIGSMYLVLFSGFGIYLFLKQIVFYNRTLHNHARKVMKDKEIGSYLGWNSIRIDEKGVRRKNQYRKEFISWDGIVRIHETDTHVFIHDTDISAMIIPKKAFGSKKEERSFVNRARKYLVASMEREGDG